MDRSGSGGERRTLDIDAESFSEYWTVLSGNTSRSSEIVSGSARIGVLTFGGMLVVWSACLHAALLWTTCRRRAIRDGKRSPSDRWRRPVDWLLVSLSLDQLAIGLFVLPVELVSEYRGSWPFGATFCQFWTPIHIGLIAGSFWNHLAITVDRCLRHVRSRDCRRDGSGAGGTRRRVTCVALVTSWAASFACAAAVTATMRHRDAIVDDVCAVDMSETTALVLAFGIYLTPAALVVAASGALIYATCRPADAPAADRQADVDHFAASARRLAKSAETGSTPSLTSAYAATKYCACATLIVANDAAAAVVDVRISGLVVLATDAVTLFFWMPFYVITLAVPFCHGVCLDPTLWTLFLWLGYSSIGICPLIWIFEPRLKATARSAVA